MSNVRVDVERGALWCQGEAQLLRNDAKKERGEKKKHAAGPSVWQHSHSFIPALHRESASLHRDGSHMHETLLQRVQAQSHTTTHVSYQAVTLCVCVLTLISTYIIHLHASVWTLSGRRDKGLLYFSPFAPPWMDARSSSCLSNRPFVSRGWSWEEWKHVCLPIKEARDKAKMKRPLWKRKHSVDGGERSESAKEEEISDGGREAGGSFSLSCFRFRHAQPWVCQDRFAGDERCVVEQREGEKNHVNLPFPLKACSTQESIRPISG